MPDDPPPIAPPIQPPPVIDTTRREVALDEHGNIAEDLECRGCGYNLQGRSPSPDPENVCPECSMPIARSIRGDELRFCDPAWVSRIVRGLKLILISVFTMFGVVVLLIVTMRSSAMLRALMCPGHQSTLPIRHNRLCFVLFWNRDRHCPRQGRPSDLPTTHYMRRNRPLQASGGAIPSRTQLACRPRVHCSKEVLT